MTGGCGSLLPEQASLLAAHDGNFELLVQRLRSRELTDVEIGFLEGVLLDVPYSPWTLKRRDRRLFNSRYRDKRLAEGERVYQLVQEGYSEAEAFKMADDEFRPEKEGSDLRRFRRAYKAFKKLYFGADANGNLSSS